MPDGNRRPPLAQQIDSIRAISADGPIKTVLPVFDLDDTRAIADFMLCEVEL